MTGTFICSLFAPLACKLRKDDRANPAPSHHTSAGRHPRWCLFLVDSWAATRLKSSFILP